MVSRRSHFDDAATCVNHNDVVIWWWRQEPEEGSTPQKLGGSQATSSDDGLRRLFSLFKSSYGQIAAVLAFVFAIVDNYIRFKTSDLAGTSKLLVSCCC